MALAQYSAAQSGLPMLLSHPAKRIERGALFAIINGERDLCAQKLLFQMPYRAVVEHPAVVELRTYNGTALLYRLTRA
jgi:hypothetical protein